MMYYREWQNKSLTANARTIDDMIRCLAAAVSELCEMRAAGVVLFHSSCVADDQAYLLVPEPDVASKFGFDVLESPAEDSQEVYEDWNH